MKTTKCPSCGASSTVTDSNEKIVCAYCHTMYQTELENSTDLSASKDHEYLHGDRPKINILLALVLFVINWILGLIYVLIITSQQKEWDKFHNKK